MSIKEVFEKYRRVAVYGMSANEAKPAYQVPKFLMSKGYEIFPINPHSDEIMGRKVARNLSDVEGDIEILDVFRPSDEAVKVVKEAIERNRSKGDIKVIWLQEGIISDEAKKLAEEYGFEFIQDKCMHVEYLKAQL
jgi:hypothetical protein